MLDGPHGSALPSCRMGIWMFWFDDNDELRPLAWARYDRLWNRIEAAPEFAGKVIRVVQAVVETQNRRPVEVRHITGHFISFDSAGVANTENAVADAVDRLDNPVAQTQYRYEYNF